MNESIDLGFLKPNLANLWQFPQTAEQLSAWFVLILVFVFTCLLLLVFWNFFKALNKYNWLKKSLAQTSESDIAANRFELKKNAQAKGSVGKLWIEFDESLVEVRTPGNVQLQNTIDASHFFNHSTLAGELTENRLIAAGPGFLTAIGVIGTFVGLQLGLAELNVGGEASVDEMKTGVAHVINGAKIAFMTSVWGVLLSVVFNIIEKLLEQLIRGKIRKIQATIDGLFHRLSVETQLNQISEHSEQSREALQGLAEQIGEKMQESLLHVSQGIQDSLETSLEKIMAPAVNKLVDETSDGNQKALESLMSQFMEGFGQQGADQRAALDNSSHKVTEAIGKMSQSMEAFVNKMEVAQDGSNEREKALVATIANQVSQLVEQGNEQKNAMTELVAKHVSEMGQQVAGRDAAAEQREKQLAQTIEQKINLLVDNANSQNEVLTTFANKQMADMTSTMGEREAKAIEMEKTRNNTFVEQTEAMRAGTEQLLQRVEQSIQNQQATADNIVDQGVKLQQSVEASVHASAKATQSMEQSATELRSAADSMNVFGSHIRDAGNNLTGAVTKAVDSTKDLAEQNQLSVERIGALRDQLVADTAQFKDLAGQLSQMIDKADNTFEQLSTSQSAFLIEQKKHVTDLSSHIAELISDYATRANGQTSEHLTVWSQSTNQFATQMQSAVSALSNVVDEIQVKVGA